MRNFLRMTGLFAVAMVAAALALSVGSAPAHASTLHHLIRPDTLAPLGFAFAGLTANAVSYPTVSDLSKGYRRSTTVLYRTYTRTVKEYKWFDDVPDEEIVPSGRENLIPLDVQPGYGAHQADDGGNESITETPALIEGAFTFNQTNSRFAISLRAQAFQKAARQNQVIQQIKYQSMKCIEAAMRKWGYMAYGFSTGIVAKVSNNPASDTTATITLKDAFGVSGLGSAAYLAGMFPVGERVGFIRSASLVGVGKVTAYSTTAGTIDVSFNGDTVDLAADDQIVYANGVNAATLSETDYNKWNVGLLDMGTSTSVHGVSKNDYDTWQASLYDTNGGSFGFVKARQMKQALENKGETTLQRIILSNGVQNDKDARERQAVLYTDPTRMSLDGAAGLKGVSEDTSRFVPEGCAFGIGADALGKKVLTGKPGEDETIDFGRLFKAEDVSAFKGGIDIFSAMICHSRSRLTLFTGLNTQGV